MNLCDCYVKEILSTPYEAYGKWWVKVIYESWGTYSESTLMFSTQEEALGVQLGHHFLA